MERRAFLRSSLAGAGAAALAAGGLETHLARLARAAEEKRRFAPVKVAL